MDRYRSLTGWSNCDLSEPKLNAWRSSRMLAMMGHELKRPRTGTLRDGIREFWTEVGNVNYRLLYFFHGNDCVVLTHGITKESKVPDSEIDSAIEKKLLFKANPNNHTFYETEQYI